MPALFKAVFKAATLSSDGVAIFFTPPRALADAAGRVYEPDAAPVDMQFNMRQPVTDVIGQNQTIQPSHCR